MILPFIDVMMNPEVIMSKAYLCYFYELLHFQSANQFMILIAFFEHNICDEKCLCCGYV